MPAEIWHQVLALQTTVGKDPPRAPDHQGPRGLLSGVDGKKAGDPLGGYLLLCPLYTYELGLFL